MSSVQNIFTQLRKSRESMVALQESTGFGTEETEEINESTEETEEINESTETLDEAEEFVVIKCHDCGAILSGLDEAEEGCPVCGSDDLDEKTVKVVRDGKVTKKNVSTKKRRLTPAQKAALAKARKKAHTPAAAKARAKSNKVRNRAGLNEADLITCPDCNFEGEYEDFEENDGVLICPDCGAEVSANEED